MLYRQQTLDLIDKLLVDLFPLCRSLTGDGTRRTLEILSSVMPLRLHEVPCGKQVFDWCVPEEWNIRDAWIKDERGEKLVDFKKNNIHLVSYSIPFRGTLSYEELQGHIHTLPEHPDWIPYRTSYYERDWGFCTAHNEFQKWDRGAKYEVFIDSSLDPKGKLVYGDLVHEGARREEILISTYCCHPSLANDNLSGLVLTSLLFKYISSKRTRFSYRFVVVPETVGAVSYLHENQAQMKKVLGGAVVSCVGGPGRFGLKHSFDQDSVVDRVAVQVLGEAGGSWREYPFIPDGSDERQYASPGFRIPTITITKDKYYEYPEYHTSADNLSFVKASQLFETLELYVRWFEYLELNRIYERKMPFCEYQLGRRGLYPNLGGNVNQPASLRSDESHYSKRYELNVNHVTGRDLEAISWLMFACDGKTDLLDISRRSTIDFLTMARTAKRLESHGLLAEKSDLED